MTQRGAQSATGRRSCGRCRSGPVKALCLLLGLSTGGAGLRLHGAETVPPAEPLAPFRADGQVPEPRSSPTQKRAPKNAEEVAVQEEALTPLFFVVQRAAGSGEALAKEAMHQVLRRGTSTPPGGAQMVGLLERAAAVLGGGQALGQSLVDLLEQAARAGDGAAALRLGTMMEEGEGLALDPVRAAGYYRAAAMAGEVDAMHNLGALHAGARGVRRDWVEGLAWLLTAQQYGAPSGEADRLRDYLAGRGRTAQIAAAEVRARVLQREIAQGGVAAALPHVAPLRYLGVETAALDAGADGTPLLDTTKRGGDRAVAPRAVPAVKLVTPTGRRLSWPTLGRLQQSADADDPAALAGLGQLLLGGEQVPLDVTRGLVLLERSAGYGNLDAALLLASAYAEGGAIARNDEASLKYYLQAARGGVIPAMVNCGVYLTNGRGAERNLVEAMAWLTLAKEWGYDSPQGRQLHDHLAARAADQLAAAGRRAEQLRSELGPATAAEGGVQP